MRKETDILQDINVIIILADKAIMFYRKQNYYRGLLATAEISSRLNKLITALIEIREFLDKDHIVINDEFIVQMLNDMVASQENEDYVLLADLYEGQLLSFLYTVQSMIRNEKIGNPSEFWEENMIALKKNNKELYKMITKEKNISKSGYNVEDTNVGVKTLKIERDMRKFYLHSNNNPFNEAEIFISEHVNKEIREYVVYGFGFGYHIRSLLESNINVCITVYESDLYILRLACEHCDLKDILGSRRLKIVYDLCNIGKCLEKNFTSFIIHYPSMMNIANKEIRERFEEYFLFYSSSKNQEDLLQRNFNKNIEKNSQYIEQLKDELENKKLIVVAGGPSLDDDIQYLKNLPEDYRILAVGRVVKKLLDEGVKPDYFIMVDANKIVIEQIKGSNLDHIPFIYLSTLYYEVLEEHKGKQYLILQEDYTLAEEYANRNHLQLYKTGGSVSTTAIEVGIRLKCSSIICVGLDLAFVDNQTHASDTGGDSITKTEKLRKVQGVDGKAVYTSKSLDSFRHWIERRISNENGIKFINVSKGANIRGMENKNLKDII